MLDTLARSNPLDGIVSVQSSFLKSKSLQERKEFGQFFTGSAVASYMASLITNPGQRNVRILDAGAGTGILTVASALKCLSLGSNSVHAVMYEVDPDALPLIHQSMNIVQEEFNSQGAKFTFEVRCQDFVLTRPDRDDGTDKFDVCVINPPYFKYSAKHSPYAKATIDLFKGDPNIYASFMAISLACLKPGGQLVAITPRSFTNGLYFKGFRNFLLEHSSLGLIHIFRQRNKVFQNQESAVLQENIICQLTKGAPASTVTIRSSDCDAGIHEPDECTYPSEFIVDVASLECLIRIPESEDEANILRQAENLATTFVDAGYFISTGPVVEHRTWDYITDKTTGKSSVPLYRPHNVRPIAGVWTGTHAKDVSFKLISGHEKHTLENNNYVLLKRFSSKDEKRRLVAAIHFKEQHGCSRIGFGNKVNYIGVKDSSLTSQEAHGLAAIFNSTFMDRYFRCISGNTQVNATEVRVMKFPSRSEITALGKAAESLTSYRQVDFDRIVNTVLPHIRIS